MRGIMKIVSSVEDSHFLIKGVTQATENRTKQQRSRFLSMLLSGIGARSCSNMLASKCVIRAGDGVIRARQEFLFHAILRLTLKYKGITKMKLNSKVFIQEIIYQKNYQNL